MPQGVREEGKPMTISERQPIENQLMNRRHEKYERLLERAKALPPLPMAVVPPCDESSLSASVTTRLASCAVAALVAKARREDPSKAVA